MTDNADVNEESMFKKLEKHKWFLGIVLLIIIFGCLAPWLFSSNALFIVFDEKTARVGDTIGGTMGPFIAIAVAILTFLAFYIQYESNIFQRVAFNKQLKEQRLQFLKAQFSSHFFELLRIHKENVANLSVKSKDVVISGEDFFLNSKLELKLYCQILKNIWTEGRNNEKEIVARCYYYYFNGLDDNTSLVLQDINNEYVEKKFWGILSRFLKNQNKTTTIQQVAVYAMYGCANPPDFIYPNIPFLFLQDKSSMLSKYYRHLYYTVKYVANQNENIISSEEKQDYLKTLRAQLSNDEQLLLFYNWYSGYGEKWEGLNINDNKFFTRYKMIHNINNADLNLNINLEELFAEYLDSENTKPMFEFQEL